MQLLPRYISAVRQYLPAAQQDDIVAELSDSIQSQMEDKETAVGRPLTLDEQSAIIKPFGPPLLAASRYTTAPSLVGPALLPYYWTTLKIVLLIAYAFDIISVVITSLLKSTPPQFGVLWGMSWATLIESVGIVTVVFAVMDFYQRRSHFVERWDPKTLPPVRDPYWIPRSTSIIELIANTLFAWVLLNVPNGLRGLLAFFYGPAAAGLTVPFTFAPWWHIYIPSLLTIAFVLIILNIVTLVRPAWGRLRAAVFAGTNLALFVVVCFVIPQRPYVVAKSEVSHAATYAAVTGILNELMLIGWVIVAAVLLGGAIWNLRKVVRRASGAKL